MEDAGSSLVRDYVVGRLVEIDRALEELDRRLDAVDCHDERARLVASAAHLVAALASFEPTPPAPNSMEVSGERRRIWP